MGNQGLLISEPPLQVLPSLATKVGLNEAIILQQIHYWLVKSNNFKDGQKWIYNSYAEWEKQFPFWSRSTLIRAVSSLERQGYLITANYNKAGFDKTKWYRIDYKKLMSKRCSQNDQTSYSKRVDGAGQNEQTNTNRLPETTTRDINNNNDDSQKPQNPENQNQKPDQNQKQKYDDPITLYRENVVKFKPYEVETILDYLKAFTELSDNQNTANGIVSLALKQALDNDSLKMSYVGAILRSWLKDKVNSVEMAQTKTDEHKQQYNQPRNSSNAPHKKTWLDEHSSMETFDFDFGEANQ
jgi:DnaD/phage-associated family protein